MCTYNIRYSKGEKRGGEKMMYQVYEARGCYSEVGSWVNDNGNI